MIAEKQKNNCDLAVEHWQEYILIDQNFVYHGIRRVLSVLQMLIILFKKIVLI